MRNAEFRIQINKKILQNRAPRHLKKYYSGGIIMPEGEVTAVVTYLLEYISRSYVTLILLVSIWIIHAASRGLNIKGTEYVRALTALIFALTVCDYLEYWCDTYDKDPYLLYIKAMLVYWFQPLIVLLELILIIQAGKRLKLLLALPQAALMLLTFLDLFDLHIVYYYEGHSFHRGPLSLMPMFVLALYIIVLAVYSLRLFGGEERGKGVVVIFMASSSILTVFGEYYDFAAGYSEEISALEVLIYYCYLAAIEHVKMQRSLYESRLALEQSRNELLMAQIQPHFIYNSLMAIQSQCIEYPPVYESIASFSRYLRANFESIGGVRPVTFAKELRNIEAYLALERLNYGDRLRVEYDIECDNFMLPALSVEPLVENAVRHGIAAHPEGGTVRIAVYEEAEGIRIEVTDEGIGAGTITAQQKKRRGIGIKNVRARLDAMCSGELRIRKGENGTTATIFLRNVQTEEEPE